MKLKYRYPLVILLLCLSALIACSKSMDSADQPDPDKPETVIPYPQTFQTACAGAPSYGDSIIFIQPFNTDYIVRPINQPDSGEYFAWPEGMVIDRLSGAINVSKSDGGLRYNIGFVRKGTTDTCMQTLILAGASYADSIYVLSDDNRYAKPYYNADPNLVNVCSGSGVPGGSTCEFDLNGQAGLQNIKIDHNDGYIDLKNTLNDGAFGLLPANGTTINTTIAYRLSDNSNLATQYLPVTLVYYNKKSDIPPGLLQALTEKLDKILNQVLLIDIFNSGTSLSRGNPRPPIIIVTRYN